MPESVRTLLGTGDAVRLIRFVHTSDLHLDRQFRGLRGTPTWVVEATRDATLQTFRNIVDFTIEQEADALLIAGDCYDGAERSLRAQLALTAGLERLDAAGVRTFLCHGHADPLDDWTSRLRFPPLVQRFGPVVESVPVRPDGPVEVVGISAPGAAALPELPRAIAGAGLAPVIIGMYHGDVAPWLGRLPDLAVDYWALGSRHRPAVVRGRDPAVVYPGAPQGTRASEDGPGGVYLVDIEERRDPATRFAALDTIRWAHIDVETLDSTAASALLERLSEDVERQLGAAQGRPLIYRITLPGEAAPDVAGIAEQLNERFLEREAFAWCHHIARRPRAVVDRQKRVQAEDLIAHILRLSGAAQSDPALRRRLRDELAPLLDDDRFSSYRSSAGFTDDQLTTIIGAAEAAVLDALGMPS